MATRTITGNINDLTDSAVASGVVTFEKVVTSTTGNTIHQFGVTTDTTDGSGNFSIDLAVPASGSYRYRMILPNGDSFYFSIAAGASVNVATLIIAETITDQDAVVEALAAYVPLAGNATMTGPLSFSGTTHRGVRLINLTTAQRDAVATPGAGALIWNTTTGTVQQYNGSAWANVGGGTAWGDITGTLANQTDLQTELTTLDGNINTVTNDLETHIEATTTVHGIADTAALLDTGDLGVSVQAYSAKTAAIAALTWAANSIILLTGTATASVQALAAHIVTLLQSASAADARAAIGAGTGNGDLLAANNLSDVTASTARTNLAVPGLATANTFTAAQMVDGIADAIQLRVQGHSSQTAKTLTVENSGGTVVASISNAGLIDTTDIQFAADTGARIYRGASSRVDFAGSINTTNFVLVNGMQALARNSNTLNVGAGANDIAIICPTVAKVNDATTNATTNIVTLGHNTSGTPAAGLGAAINFTLETSTTVDTQAGRVAVLWETVTHASRVPDGVFYLTDSSAEREIWRGRATGSAAAIGFLGATPVARQAHIADAAGDDAATVNAILDVLEAFGLVATS